MLVAVLFAVISVLAENGHSRLAGYLVIALILTSVAAINVDLVDGDVRGFLVAALIGTISYAA